MSHVAPENSPLVSIIIPAFNKWEYTFKCLMAVAAHTRDVSHEVIVIDNASSDDTARALPLLEGIRFQRNERNLGFARASNQGAAMARGKYLMFLNNDTEARAGWLSSMVGVLDREPDVAMVGSKLLFPDGTLQHAGVVFAYAAPLPVTAFHLHYRQPPEVSRERMSMRAVTGACMLIRADVFRAVGAFDDAFINGYEDVDLCLKVSGTGAKIIYNPDSVLVHHESVSEGRFTADLINVELLNQRWLGLLHAFDVDFRREVQPPRTDPGRPGVSVILPVRDALWSIAPCLEALRYATGDQDEIIIVDDGSLGAARDFVVQFVARYPRFRQLYNEVSVGLPRAALQGLESATRARVVVMPPSVRVTGDWLARLGAHLDANPRLGAVAPTSMPIEGLPTHQILCPIEYAPPSATGLPVSGVANPGPAKPGDVEEIEIPPIRLVFAARDRLLEIARRVPEVLLGEDQARLGVELRAQGLALGRARDTGAYRLTQIPGDPEPELARRYAVQSSANLAYEQLYREAGGPVIGRVTAAQTELTSIVIVARDNLSLTADCLASIYASTHRSFEIVLVDNGSTEDLAGLAARTQATHGNVTLLRRPRDIGYAQACNQGLAAARGEYLVLLHNDVVVTPGWLARQLALMALDPVVGVTGPVFNACTTEQVVGMRTYRDVGGIAPFAEAWAVYHATEISITVPLSGICLTMKRQVVSRIGGLDPSFGSAIHTDDDFCIRAYRAGYRMGIAFDAFVHHHGGATWKRLGLDRVRAAADSRRAFCAKWGLSPDANVRVAARELGARPFDPAHDHVPLVTGDGATAQTEQGRAAMSRLGEERATIVAAHAGSL